MQLNLAAVREKQNLSYGQLERKSGISHVYLRELERGEKSPTLRTLGKIADALEVSVIDLINDTRRES